MKKTALRLLPHLALIFSLAAIALCILDGVNPHMGFLRSGCGRGVLLAACALSIAASVCTLRKE